MKRLKYLSTLLVAAVALIAAWLLWNFYTQSPWTRDGKVRAEQVGITPQVSGSILQLNVTDNQRVKAGEVLFTIDDTPYRIAVLNAQAQLAKAQAEVAKAQAEQSKAASEARRRRSLSQNAISAEDLENVNTALNTATTTLAAARAGVGVTEAALKHAQWQLSQTVVKAPVDGWVTNLST
ncbi:efflux transporter periplasmic adaptor subunit, partial [Klebsiella pneumoniae]